MSQSANLQHPICISIWDKYTVIITVSQLQELQTESLRSPDTLQTKSIIYMTDISTYFQLQAQQNLRTRRVHLNKAAILVSSCRTSINCEHYHFEYHVSSSTRLICNDSRIFIQRSHYIAGYQWSLHST